MCVPISSHYYYMWREAGAGGMPRKAASFVKGGVKQCSTEAGR